MSTPIQGFGAFSGFQLSEESAWGTPIGTWIEAPIIAETHRTERQFAPPSPEFGDTGAQTVVAAVSSNVVGELRFNARLDARWFHIILAHVLGTEDLYADEHVDGSAGVGANTHWYIPSNQGRSLAFRVWKSGPNNSGSWSQFVGCIVQSARIEWVADGLLVWAVQFLGKEESLANVSGTLTPPTGSIVTDPRWASNTGAELETGASPAPINFRGFVINVNRQLTTTPSFANNILGANQPGPTAKRDVTIDITSILEQDYAASGKPYREFRDLTDSTARVKLRDTVATAAGGVYSLDFDFPSITWRAGSASLSEGGDNPTSITGQAKKGTSASPGTGDVDWRVGVEVLPADEPSADDHFTFDTGQITQLTAGA